MRTFGRLAKKMKMRPGWVPSRAVIEKIVGQGNLLEGRLSVVHDLLMGGLPHKETCPKSTPGQKEGCDCGLDWVRRALGLPETGRTGSAEVSCRICHEPFDPCRAAGGRCPECNRAWRHLRYVRKHAKPCPALRCAEAIEV